MTLDATDTMALRNLATALERRQTHDPTGTIEHDGETPPSDLGEAAQSSRAPRADAPPDGRFTF